ncbi:hypothetical protein ACLF6K_07200 [Streptomyces xanthophaeus]
MSCATAAAFFSASARWAVRAGKAMGVDLASYGRIVIMPLPLWR